MAGPSREQELSPFLPGQHRALSLGPESALSPLSVWKDGPHSQPSFLPNLGGLKSQHSHFALSFLREGGL